jgi:hypothetical protein
MRKSYLPRPSGVPGADNPRRVLSTVPLEIDLDRSSDRFSCFQLQEPDLIFGGSHRCVDPRTGLAAYGPYGVTQPEHTGQVRVGIVGTSEAIDNTIKFLDEISRPIEQDADVDCVLHPSFPGLNSQEPFRVHLVTQSQWHRPLHKRGFRSINECGDPRTRRWLLQELFGAEVRAISELDNPPQVIVCAISEPITSLLGIETASEDANFALNEEILPGGGERISHRLLREFRSGLKAECMGCLPTEIIWDPSCPIPGGIRDRATRAWTLSLALLNKAALVPWRMAYASEDSCFIGISFYRASHSASSHTLKSFAHVVTELGDGFVVDGDAFEWDPCKEGDKAPRLDEAQARTLLSRALAVFEKETGVSPRKAAVHKSTPYSDAERGGFEKALCGIPQYGLMTITQRGIFCVRPGRNPILRGTAIPFDEKIGLVFSSGYVSFLRGYYGNRIPQPLEIAENWGTLSFQQAAQDLIRLRKLDLNSPDFCTNFPLTLLWCRETGDIPQALGRREPALDDRYYV